MQWYAWLGIKGGKGASNLIMLYLSFDLYSLYWITVINGLTIFWS